MEKFLGKRHHNNKKDHNKPKKNKIKNKYEGFIPKKDWKIETIYSDMDPKEFFEKYVSQRKPVLIKEKDPKNPKFDQFKWTRELMREKAGNSQVFIEQRANIGEEFGTGKSKVKMLFKEYLDIEENKDKYYMTTQKIPYDNVGPKYLCDSPILELLDKENYQNPLIGNLIPNQFNMWMGYSGKLGSSTGLHHDYHDNIYVLVKGRKRFTISCPVNAPELPTNGGIKVVHKNGLIVYNQDIESDGHYSDSENEDNEEEEKQLFPEQKQNNKKQGDESEQEEDLCPKALKKKILKLEQEIETLRNKNSNNEKLSELERELENLMDKQLDMAFNNDEIVDDFEDLDKDSLDEKNQGGIEDEEEDQEEPLQNDPDNFVIKELQKKDLKPICNSTAVEINEGQMLYLPASWYHQVSSYGEFHFAFNIWMHPPNNNSFEKPYKTDFWKKRYQFMKQKTEEYKEQKSKLN